MNDVEETVFDDEFEPTDAEGLEQGSKGKIKDLQGKIKALEKEKSEYLTGWQRARADYANLQKAHEEDKKRLKELFAGNILSDFIPTIDSFQMAMSNKEAWEKVDTNWRTGVEYIYNQLLSALETHGLTMFGEVGETFDPARYEAVSEEEADDESKDHRIAKVIQKGFMLGDAVIRPARVVVWKSK
ncbi:MAG TPA: nucleotide exchange factor GrpE [Candidatus Paceibacterota bacterium]|nr:nucleotide exchange factor GrpE [Candidatus Paceibacterota bacterium]